MWENKGLIFKPNNQWDWLKSHANVPTAIELDNCIRVYFASRNNDGKSIPVFIDLDKDDPTKVLNVAEKPIIELGEIGTFDDAGINACSVLKKDGIFYLYYVGWMPTVSVPYRNSIGLLTSEDGINFKRIHQGPIVDRTKDEPFFTASPYVMIDEDKWKMWYASGHGFVSVKDNTYSPLYHLKYAESDDGINWKRNNISCIIPRDKYECTARPSVIKEDGIYKMWYCYRGSFDYRDGKDSYQIGYADSTDGVSWVRKDNEVGLNTSPCGFDSEMATYPSVIDVKNNRYMFYNGNGFGVDGIGLAIYKK